jgi:hypothetical protein
MLPIKTNQPGVGPQGIEHPPEQMGEMMFNKELEDWYKPSYKKGIISLQVNHCDISYPTTD